MPLDIDTVTWLTDTEILVGTSMLDGDGEEDGPAPLMVLSCKGSWHEAELTQILAYPMAEVCALTEALGPVP